MENLIRWFEAEDLDKDQYLSDNADTELEFFSLADGRICYTCNNFSVSGVPNGILERVEVLSYLLSSLTKIEITPV